MFTSGRGLTSADVKFSILRAIRLAPQKMSMLAALRSIETPDDTTVRFRLKYPDNQFGFGLAVPAASIVDHVAYDSDKLRPVEQAPIGTGPYQLDSWDSKGLTIARYARYRGPLGTDMPRIRIAWSDSRPPRRRSPDAKAEIVWRTLSPAAIDRLQNRIVQDQDDGRPAGYHLLGPAPGGLCSGWSGCPAARTVPTRRCVTRWRSRCRRTAPPARSCPA